MSPVRTSGPVRQAGPAGPEEIGGPTGPEGATGPAGPARTSGPAGHAGPASPLPEPRTARAGLRAWAELLRISALFTVPGDALAGAAAAGARPNRGTAFALGASLCLYEAGMALNDWSDRAEDAIDRPHRPIPSGRITPAAALTASAALTAAGLALASRAGRPALAVATALSATVWAYDLHLKHTKAGPAAMAAARGLDLLLGATATLSGGSANAIHNGPGTPRGSGFRGPAASAAADVRRTRAAHPDTPPRTPHSFRPASPSDAVGTIAATRAVRGVTWPLTRALGAPPGVATAPGTVLARPARAGLMTWPTPLVTAAASCGAGRGPAGGAQCSVPPMDAAAPGLLRTPGADDAAAALRALPAAALLAAHTYAVTSVSRHEAQGGSTLAPLAALATTAAIAAAVSRPGTRQALPARALASNDCAPRRGPDPARHRARWSLPPSADTGRAGENASRLVTSLLTAAYLRTTTPPLLHAVLNPSPPLTQRAVGGGIRAMIPLQSALAARAGANVTGLAVMGLVPLARTLARKVSLT
ncbi:UbiA family prenyltransferase [Streptomyces sp. NPDC002187]|uniref:UbiA family prenyltransferase n=1 Tax=Streptomyces sp. NPDC002187 TaxID=3364637 RepID=UPI0036ACB0DE